MATIASPIFDRYFGRPPLPLDAVLPAPAAPGEVRIVWYPKPQAGRDAGGIGRALRLYRRHPCRPPYQLACREASPSGRMRQTPQMAGPSLFREAQ